MLPKTPAAATTPTIKAGTTRPGKPAPRLHGFGHVTGAGQYSEHMTQPGMLFMKSLLSPHPHAKIKRIDTSKAEKFPGVRMPVLGISDSDAEELLTYLDEQSARIVDRDRH